MRLIFATNNNHKLSEIKAILREKYENNIFSLSDFDLSVDPDETGATFDENANIKSSATYNVLKENKLLKIGDYIISDDTGLMIDYFNGAPGIYSARFMGDISQKEKNEKIIEDMKGCKDDERKAHFETHLSVVEIKNDRDIINMPKPLIFIGKMDGFITDSLIGNEGFGYDPIFAVGSPSDYIDKKNIYTYSSMGQKEKNKISHRAKAINSFIDYLEKK